MERNMKTIFSISKIRIVLISNEPTICDSYNVQFGSYLTEILKFELKLRFENLWKSAKNKSSILVQAG